ncbi:carboxymuconolactone decarboxylase family protein [Phytohabitans kaempferiae]|uniref:Carboxymuconolactone decarboxylase family protein n=1 Tax=Phytohabitans kaempferiae TaxID=1620943 RepID=A0ABV6M5N5_9ACTN
MPHIDLGVDDQTFPGMAGLAQYRPDTAGPMLQLAQILLRGPSTLPPGERELIASYVSTLNGCGFMILTHGAFAAAQLDGGMPLVTQVNSDPETAPVSDKLRALLRIAAATRESGRQVSEEAVKAARAAGATDLEIHDTVLIAAATSMFNRYVDGLATSYPDDPAPYAEQAKQVIANGYNTDASF